MSHLERSRLVRAVILAGLKSHPLPPPKGDEPRFGGGVICEACGLELYDHPGDPAAHWLTILCSRERVKL